jgi:hypothetical protein
MNPVKQVPAMILCATALLFAGLAANAQTSQVPSRVVDPVDETRTVKTQGNVHPMARAEFDKGALGDSTPITRMQILLQRSTGQETALRQLMEDQQTKGTANYHKWLTPTQFGTQFGPSDADVQAVTDWLTRQGFQISKVSAGRTTIEFSGTAGQVRSAFQTEIHKFSTNGTEFIANVSDPSIPQALSPVLKGVVALHNYPRLAHARQLGTFQKDLATGKVTAQFTYTDSNGTFYGVGPADFAKIYNIPTGADGTGQKIGIIGQSNINIQDIIDFRTIFGIAPTYPANNVTIILNGPDPGTGSSDEGESDLDLEWAGAVAPGAQLIFVTTQSTQSNPTQVSNGVDLSALYAVDNNVAPVLSESYGSCEAALGTTGNQFFSTLWQQAAAQGITVSVSSGDSGSAGCDSPNSETAASSGLAVNGIASTPYNVAMGGTDFNQVNNWTTYWSATNGATTQVSALGYIPELPWDDSPCASAFPAVNFCASVDPNGLDLSAGSGGPSNCVVSTTNSSTGAVTCTTNNSNFPNGGYPKPAWQVNGTPADSVRDIPDVSLFASDGAKTKSFYIVCQSDLNAGNAPCDLSTSANSGTHNFGGVGGTSSATPTFAAIMALVNQYQLAHGGNGRQGNPNFVLYALAASNQNYTSGKCNSAGPPAAGCVFNDVIASSNTNGTPWNNSVACIAGATGGSPNCSNTSSSGYGVLVSTVALDKGTPAFQAVQGYDLATGLGSVNVSALLSSWSSVARTTPTVTLTSPNGGSPSGQTFTASVTVVPAPGGKAGSESVALNAIASDGVTILGSFGPFVLNGGTASISTNLLPPQTANVQASYGGDALLTSNVSSIVALSGAVSGAGANSNTTLNFVTFNANTTPATPILNMSPSPVTYGSPYILQIAVTKSGSGTCSFSYPNTSPAVPCPTGTITLTDNGVPLNDFPNGVTQNATNVSKLNNVGFAEDQPIQLPAGSHSIVAAYAGDANYQASKSNTLSVTITKAATTTNVGSSLGTITSGQSVTLSMIVTTPSNGAGPTGNVRFAENGTTLGSAVACTPTSGAQNTTGLNGTTARSAFCTATLTTAISSLYPVPVNEPKTPPWPFVLMFIPR